MNEAEKIHCRNITYTRECYLRRESSLCTFLEVFAERRKFQTKQAKKLWCISRQTTEKWWFDLHTDIFRQLNTWQVTSKCPLMRAVLETRQTRRIKFHKMFLSAVQHAILITEFVGYFNPPGLKISKKCWLSLSRKQN